MEELIQISADRNAFQEVIKVMILTKMMIDFESKQYETLHFCFKKYLYIVKNGFTLMLILSTNLVNE